jgi:hypothetical protein
MRTVQTMNSGSVKQTPSRFVVLHHQLPAAGERPSHFDLMLEQVDGLRTYALSQWPPDRRPQSVLALPIHDRRYLDYEGPVSHDRGTVRRIASGTYRSFGDLPVGSNAGERWTILLQMAEGPELALEIVGERIGPHDQSWWISSSAIR